LPTILRLFPVNIRITYRRLWIDICC